MADSRQLQRLVDCLDRNADRAGAAALFYEDPAGRSHRYSFGDIIEACRRFANALAALGIGRGDVVAIQGAQRPETAIAHMAIYRLGAVALPISGLFGDDALRYRLAHSGARAILVEPEAALRLEPMRAELPELRHVIVAGGKHGGLNFDDLTAAGAPVCGLTPTGPDDPLLLMYTSGTTGNPKGVLQAGGNVIGRNGFDYALNFLRADDVYFSPADWAWSAGLTGLLCPWAFGIPVVAHGPKGKFDPEAVYRRLEKYRVTVAMFPPPALELMRQVSKPRGRYQLALRCVFVTAGSPSAGLTQWMDEELRVAFNVGFGQTEANTVIGTCTALERRQPGALGKAYPGHDVAIVSEDGTVLKEGESGIIALRRGDPVLMKEYWKDPDALSRKFIGQWMLTGDCGQMDGQGNVYFLGRADDVIKSSGYRIGPDEVEAALMEDASVAACAVIGAPDSRRGQVVKALVKLRAGHTQSAAIVTRLQERVRSRVGAHAYPRQVEFVDDFPLTVTGKIKRKELRDRDLARHTSKV
ncbi:MAG: AMP-binding protein [Candidatus Binataceae bacterium]